MLVLSIDWETWCELPIAVGIDKYSRACRILMMAYKLVGVAEEPKIWWPGEPVPQVVFDVIASGGRIAGWNSLSFERIVWRNKAVPDHGFPPVPDDIWIDSMHLAAAANLPRSLDGAAKAVGAAAQKDAEGHRLMLRVTNGKRTPWPPKREDLARLATYCIQDVRTEEETALRMPAWPSMHPWRDMPAIDRRINDRGILVDVPLVQGLVRAAKLETARLDVEIARLTDHAVPATTNVGKLKEWLVASGVQLPRVEEPDPDSEDDDPGEDDEGTTEKEPRWRLRKSDVADILARTDVPDKCRLALEMRQEAAKASARKLTAMLNACGADGRLRGLLVLMGAQATGRFSSRAVQMHNLVRDCIANPDEVADQNGLDAKKDKDRVAALSALCLQTAIELGRRGDPDAIRAVFGMARKDLQGRERQEGVLPFVSRMLRRVIAAPAGRLLLNGDFANIEARIPMWLSGQQDKVDAFAHGEDVYRLQAAPVYGKRPEQLTKQERQVGKVQVLFLGFAGGVNAFIPAAMNYGLTISRVQGEPLVRKFREDNAHLVAFWDNALQAAVNAVTYPGRAFAVPPLGNIVFCMQGGALCARLPSGRLLRYWAPRLQQGFWPDGKPKPTPDLTVLVMRGKNALRRTLWRGLLVENLTQAIAADLLVNALANMDAAGTETVLHVHDSVAAEEDEDRAEALLPTFKQAMLAAPGWARGLPLAVDADISARFG